MFLKVSEEPDMSSTINETSKHLREQECLFLSHIFLRCLMSSMGTKLKYLRPWEICEGGKNLRPQVQVFRMYFIFLQLT